MSSLYPAFMGSGNSAQTIIEVAKNRTFTIENQNREISTTVLATDTSGSENNSSIQERTLFVGEQMREIAAVEQPRVINIIFETRIAYVEA